MPEFVELYRSLPTPIKRTAKKNFKLWQRDPRRLSLRFKRVAAVSPVFSVRVGRDWRALAFVSDGVASWFWIGPHDEYERLIRAM